jgi:hypothetical protein
MSTLYVDNIYSKTGTSQALEIDSSGQVLLSAIPFMKMTVGTSVNISATTLGTTTPYNNVISSRGITLNASTYKFQVPVTGLYHFSGAVRLNASAADYIWWGVADSSGTILQLNQLVLANYRSPTSNFSTCAGSVLQPLTASTDYQIIVGISASSVGTQTVSGGQTWMDIYLVGGN